MGRGLMKRRWLLALAALVTPLMAFGFIKWRQGTINGGQQYAEPFRIAGNFYYVGANDVTAFLITGPEGHVLIDGGYPGTARMIMASIAELGFDTRDVKILLNSEPHYDHAGGLAELQKASGAEVWASDASAAAIETGGIGPDSYWPTKLFVWTRIARYPPTRVHHRFKDGDTIRLGPIELTAHITGGHTKGCTSWSFPVRDGERELQVVHACSLTVFSGLVRLVEPERYPGIRADYERTFRVLRSLPVDIWVTTHARRFDRYRKFVERAKAEDPVAPFIDREGYLAYIASAEESFRKVLAEQQRKRDAE